MRRLRSKLEPDPANPQQLVTLRGLGALFIPALPILTTGAILLLASVFDAWRIWTWLWPLEVIALALGFAFAAIYMQTVWLAVPAIIIGLNGLLFQFCAITGWWNVWAVMWTIEPLAVGLSLLAASIKTRSNGLTLAGLLLCGLAAPPAPQPAARINPAHNSPAARPGKAGPLCLARKRAGWYNATSTRARRPPVRGE